MSGIVIPVGGSGGSGGSGGGAELDVTAYSAVGSLPASDDEGAVAVITSTAINDVYAQADEPGSPSSGDVWIWLGCNQLVDIDIGSNILLPPKAAFQYVASAWVYKESYVYSSSAWVEVTLYVYDTGAELLSTISIGNRSRTNNTLTKYSTYMRVFREFGGGAGTQISVMTDTAINLTDVSTIKIRCSRSGNTGSAALKVGLDRTSYTYVASATISQGTDIEYMLDVSALNGVYYFGVFMDGTSTSSNDTVDITKLWLNK